jgi:hypothetical protein
MGAVARDQLILSVDLTFIIIAARCACFTGDMSGTFNVPYTLS